MNIFLTAYFNKVKDPERDKFWEADPKALDTLRKSIGRNQLVILTDCILLKKTFLVTYHKAEAKRNPYFERWFHFHDYLIKNPQVKNVFMLDATDTEVLKDPFPEISPALIYVGDEPDVLDSKWIKDRHPNFAGLFDGSKLPLLNPGILGGSTDVIVPLLFDLKMLYFLYGERLGKTDMAAVNLLLHTKYKDIIRHGPPVNTKFNKWEKDRDDCYFRHK